MRLAVAIAAWSSDPDATLPPAQEGLSSALGDLGFTVVRVPLGEAEKGLGDALSGVEDVDTLLVHVSGMLGGRGQLVTNDGLLSLEVVGDALASKPAKRVLVVVEAVYRGEEDAMVAVDEVEGVTDALAAPGDRAIVVAVHPARVHPASLDFTTSLIRAANAVAGDDGTAFIAEAYAHARTGAGIAASAYAFQRGETPFELGRGLKRTTPSVTPPAPTDAELPQPIPSAAITANALDDEDDDEAPDTTPRPTPGEVEALASPARELIDARIAAATEAGDHGLVVQLCRERLPTLPTAEERVDELFEIARTLVASLQDLPEAVTALEEARGMDATRLDVHEALRRAYARLERWPEALATTLTLVTLTDGPRERAGLRVAAAELAAEHVNDEDQALELLTQALDDDPTHEAALAALVRIRRWRGDLIDLEHALASLAHRLVDAGDAARAWDACQRLASLRRDDLGDAAGAVEALAMAKRLPLSELDSRAVLAEQLLALGDDEGAAAELEAIALAQPMHPRAHARLFGIHHRRGHHDRAYLTALVLEELGEADPTAREVLDAYRADWGLRARAALDGKAWQVLRAPGADETVEAVFRAALRAVVAGQFEDVSRRPALDPARRQSEKSTGSIVRCFHWAARALGLTCPALYILDDVSGIAAVSAPEPTTALGPDVLRGLSSRTLAFLAGRHLTYFRPEYQVLVHFPTAEAAAGLFFAAVDLVAPGTFVPPNLALRVSSLKTRLARHLRAEELAAISAAVGQLEAREAKVDLLGWIRSVELTAGRAGLLLAGDLQTALTQVRAEERGLSGLGVDDRRADLVAFCASNELAELRAAFADTTPSSMRPPTTESGVVRSDDARLQDPSGRDRPSAPPKPRLTA